MTFIKVRTFWLQADKVPEVVVRTLALGNLVMRFGLHRVDDIWEFYGVLDEEYGN